MNNVKKLTKAVEYSDIVFQSKIKEIGSQGHHAKHIKKASTGDKVYVDEHFLKQRFADNQQYLSSLYKSFDIKYPMIHLGMSRFLAIKEYVMGVSSEDYNFIQVGITQYPTWFANYYYSKINNLDYNLHNFKYDQMFFFNNIVERFNVNSMNEAKQKEWDKVTEVQDEGNNFRSGLKWYLINKSDGGYDVKSKLDGILLNTNGNANASHKLDQIILVLRRQKQIEVDGKTLYPNTYMMATISVGEDNVYKLLSIVGKNNSKPDVEEYYDELKYLLTGCSYVNGINYSSDSPFSLSYVYLTDLLTSARTKEEYDDMQMYMNSKESEAFLTSHDRVFKNMNDQYNESKKSGGDASASIICNFCLKQTYQKCTNVSLIFDFLLNVGLLNKFIPTDDGNDVNTIIKSERITESESKASDFMLENSVAFRFLESPKMEKYKDSNLRLLCWLLFTLSTVDQIKYILSRLPNEIFSLSLSSGKEFSLIFWALNNPLMKTDTNAYVNMISFVKKELEKREFDLDEVQKYCNLHSNMFVAKSLQNKVIVGFSDTHVEVYKNNAKILSFKRNLDFKYNVIDINNNDEVIITTTDSSDSTDIYSVNLEGVTIDSSTGAFELSDRQKKTCQRLMYSDVSNFKQHDVPVSIAESSNGKITLFEFTGASAKVSSIDDNVEDLSGDISQRLVNIHNNVLLNMNKPLDERVIFEGSGVMFNVQNKIIECVTGDSSIIIDTNGNTLIDKNTKDGVEGTAFTFNGDVEEGKPKLVHCISDDVKFIKRYRLVEVENEVDGSIVKSTELQHMMDIRVDGLTSSLRVLSITDNFINCLDLSGNICTYVCPTTTNTDGKKIRTIDLKCKYDEFKKRIIKGDLETWWCGIYSGDGPGNYMNTTRYDVFIKDEKGSLIKKLSSVTMETPITIHVKDRWVDYLMFKNAVGFGRLYDLDLNPVDLHGKGLKFFINIYSVNINAETKKMIESGKTNIDIVELVGGKSMGGSGKYNIAVVETLNQIVIFSNQGNIIYVKSNDINSASYKDNVNAMSKDEEAINYNTKTLLYRPNDAKENEHGTIYNIVEQLNANMFIVCETGMVGERPGFFFYNSMSNELIGYGDPSKITKLKRKKNRYNIDLFEIMYDDDDRLKNFCLSNGMPKLPINDSYSFSFINGELIIKRKITGVKGDSIENLTETKSYEFAYIYDIKNDSFKNIDSNGRQYKTPSYTLASATSQIAEDINEFNSSGDSFGDIADSGGVDYIGNLLKDKKRLIAELSKDVSDKVANVLKNTIGVSYEYTDEYNKCNSEMLKETIKKSSGLVLDEFN